MARIGGSQNIYTMPSEVPIRDYANSIMWEGHECRILYAGYRVPQSRIVQETDFDAGTRVNYGLCEESWGPISYVLGSPDMIGTHGFLVFCENLDGEEECDAYLFSIAVPVKYWRSGIAQRMMLRMERILRNKGKRRVKLMTRDTLPGYAFFRKLGYFVTQDDFPFDRSGDLVEMTKSIAHSTAFCHKRK